MKTKFNLLINPLGKLYHDLDNNLLKHCISIEVDVSHFDEEDWISLTRKCILTEELMDLYIDKIEHNVFYVYQKLSEDFIIANKDRLNLSIVCCWQDLSEDFMREYKDQLHWDNISSRQKLSKEFIIEFAHKLDFKQILFNEKISKEIKDYCRMFI